MRFHLGAIPESPDFRPDDSWKPLRELTPWMSQLIALPLGFVVCVAIGAAWVLFTPLERFPFDSPGLILIAFLALIPVHEFIHFAVHPKSKNSEQSVLGLWPSRGLFYAHYLGELSRNRFVAILIMPLLVLSFGPLFVCAIARCSSNFLAIASTLNALCACVDVLGIILLLFQVPRNAVVRNQGWKTFWRASPNSVV